MKRYLKQTVPAHAPLIQAFRNPQLDSRPMARMWFCDAYAGAAEDDCIEKQLRTMAQGGMGGVEIALLADGCGIENAKEFGWGTPNWTKTLKKIMKAAQGIPGGFKVDFTISPHWPPNIYTIDPNDDAASSDLLYAWKKVTAEDIARGSMDVPMPETRKFDQKNNPFLFKNTFVGANLAWVSDMPRPKMRGFKPPPEMGQENGYAVIGALPEGVVPADESPKKPDGPGFQPPEGMEFVPEGMRREDIDWNSPFEPLPWRSRAEITLQHDSLQDVSAQVSVKQGSGWKCGVPDQEALDRWYDGVSIETVDEAFDVPADETDLLPDGKRDSQYRRVRMADWQEEYTLNLNGLDVTPASPGEELRPGDLILIGFFYRGSGQQLSGGGPWKIMPNQTYVANYLIPEGIDAITGYWDKHILSDPELRAMVEENGRKYGGSIFEDSIELHTYGAPWGKGFERYIPEKMGYPIGTALPILAGFATDCRTEDVRITQDFAAAIGKLYTENHVQRVSRWAKSFHYNFRAQAYSLGGLGITEAALATDVTEGDNSTYHDALRQLQTAVNVKPDEKFLSMESNTFKKFGFSWKALIQEVNDNASQGVNRVIFHGCAHPRNGTGYIDWWPGWNWGEKAHGSTFMAWDNRNTWWDDAHSITDYIARLQTVLQEGKRRVDLAILPNIQGIYELAEGNSHQRLLDLGYSYNLIDENVLRLPYLSVEDGKLFPDGPAYRVLVLADCDYLHQDTLQTVVSLAKQGLPVILEGKTPDQVFGVSRPGNEDAALHSLLEELRQLPNVRIAADDQGVHEAISAMNLGPAAAYDAENLECSHITDSETDYYFFYNNNVHTVTVPVTLSGHGTPVLLDCWSGETLGLPEAQAAAHGVTLPLTIAAGDIALVALVAEQEPQFHAVTSMDETVLDGLSLELTSFGPPSETDAEYDPSYPTTFHKVTLNYDSVPNFSSWAKLPATDAQLSELRVPSMADVSGIGIYRGTFTLPEDAVTADLKLGHHNKDVAVTVTVNGQNAGTPDPMTDVLSLDGLVHPGENTVEIKLCSTLDNRLYYEDPIAAAKFPPEKDLMAKLRPPFVKDDWTIRYPVGLYSTSIVPYRA